MRPIKFRAWSKLAKCFVPTEVFSFRIFDCEKERKQFAQHYELMQYTGLKDKNGKEIYEGDIVQIYEDVNENMEIDEIGTVVYHEDAFGVGVNDEADGALYSVRQFTNCKYAWIEVIGNIYENPELLGGK